MTETTQQNGASDSGTGAFEPRIVGFLCNWCSYAGADKAGAAGITYPPNVRTIRVMCTGRIDPQFVLAAFASGADGVLILGCHPGDCHYKEQNYRAVQRHRVLLRVLRQFGVDEARCRFGFVSAAEAAEFAATVTEMTQELRRLGPAGFVAASIGAGRPAGRGQPNAATRTGAVTETDAATEQCVPGKPGAEEV